MPFNATRMRDKRDKLKLSRMALAVKLGVDPQTIYRWESGATSPAIDMLDRIAKALKMSVKDLVRD